MSQSGYTPILIYASGTTGNTPSAANLTSTSTGAELALNYFDGKLFYKDASGNVQVLASKAGNINVSSISFGTTGLTPNTATTGAITVAGTLITSNGGTGLSSYTAGDLPYYASGTALSKLAIGTANYILSSSGTAPQWVNSINIGSGTFSSITDSGLTSGRVTYAGTSGLLQDSSNLTFNGTTLTANTLNLTNALGVAYGGTGLTTLTSGYIPYGNGTSAFSSASTLSYSSTSGLTVNGITQSYNTTLYNVDGTLSNYASNNSVYLNGNAAGALQLRGDGTGAQQVIIKGGSSSYISINTASTEVARFTSAGYLGIGTSSPSYPLDLGAGTAQTTFRINSLGTSGYGPYIRFDKASVQKNLIGSYSAIISGTSDDLAYWSATGAGHQWIVNNGGSASMTLDSSGNLGLGVTPSAWASGYKALQINSTGSIASAATYTSLNDNFYLNTSFSPIYLTSSYATRYIMNNAGGSHQWFIAPSGTAGNAITFTQALTLDNSGNLLLGTTSSPSGSNQLVVAGNIFKSTASNSSVATATNTTNTVLAGATTGTYLVTANSNISGSVVIGGMAMVTIYYDGSTGKADIQSMSTKNFTWSSITSANNSTNGTITYQQTSGFTASTVTLCAVKLC